MAFLDTVIFKWDIVVSVINKEKWRVFFACKQKWVDIDIVASSEVELNKYCNIISNDTHEVTDVYLSGNTKNYYYYIRFIHKSITVLTLWTQLLIAFHLSSVNDHFFLIINNVVSFTGIWETVRLLLNSQNIYFILSRMVFFHIFLVNCWYTCFC